MRRPVPSLTPVRSRSLPRLLQAALVGMLLLGAATGYVALAVTLVPGVTLVVAVAAFLHVVGMAGPYERIWWWNHVTHALSAAMVAAAASVTVRAIDEYSDAIDLPQPYLSVWPLAFTLAAGVGRELAEFDVRAPSTWAGVEPILVQYSVEDTLLDLVFDAVGEVAVAAAGGQSRRPLVDRAAEALDPRRERT